MKINRTDSLKVGQIVKLRSTFLWLDDEIVEISGIGPTHIYFTIDNRKRTFLLGGTETVELLPQYDTPLFKLLFKL